MNGGQLATVIETKPAYFECYRPHVPAILFFAVLFLVTLSVGLCRPGAGRRVFPPVVLAMILSPFCIRLTLVPFF
jgi:hypothetical protein